MTAEPLRCEGPGCEVVITHVRTAGNPQRFCSARCRGRAFALAHPRALRTAILKPGYVALPVETIVQSGGGNGIEAGVLAASGPMAVGSPVCAPIGQMLSTALEARLAELEKRPRFGRSSGQDPSRWTHGRNCYRNHGCRCERCVTGERLRSQRRRQPRMGNMLR